MSEHERHVGRERWMAGVLLFIVALFLARLVQLQVYHHVRAREIVRRQSSFVESHKPSRGRICDRHGRDLAVTLPLTYTIVYHPLYVIDFDGLASALALQLGKPWNEFRAKFDQPSYHDIANKVEWQSALLLQALDYACLDFKEDPRRAYPSEQTAASVIGFVNFDGQGVDGVEAFMNAELSGAKFDQLCWRNALRDSIAALVPIPSSYRGADVRLTLDLTLQTLLEDKLLDGLRGRVYERACAIILDPDSGDILGMATQPSFDLNQPGSGPARKFRCWPVTDVYEPGSTLKIVPIARALESGRLHRTSYINCRHGQYAVPGAIIHDSHKSGFGDLTVDQVLAFSSNIGAAIIASHLEPNDFYDQLRAFGLGNPTMVELPNEATGHVPVPSSWTGPTMATMAFGQGVSCTPLQLTLAYAAIANGGNLMKPRLVQSVTFPSGEHVDFKVQTVRRAISQRTAEQLSDMLVGVVEFGTGTTVKIPGVRIAGKTGTAEKVNTVHGGLLKDRFISSFAGFFPADHPHYVLLIVVDDPRGEYYGAQVAGPIFKSIVEDVRVLRPAEFSGPSAYPMMAAMMPVSPMVHTSAAPQEANSITVVPAPHAANDSSLVLVPAVHGMSLRAAIQEYGRFNLGLRIYGNSTIVTQNPPAGTPVPRGSVCDVYAIAS